MKHWWQSGWEKQSARINALSLRERALLFLSVLASGMALVEVLWLSPAQMAHRQLTQRFEKQSTELQRLRESFKSVAQPVDGSRGLREEITVVQRRLDALDQSMKNLLPTTAQATPLAQVLAPLLRRHDGLTLVRITTMDSEAAAKATGARAGAGFAAMPPGFVRQGVELTVSGPYSELTRYVESLEQALPHVRWGSMKLISDKPAPKLTLQLFLLGMPA